MKKYRFILFLFVISILVQIIVTDIKFETFVGTVVVQIFSSIILGYVFTQFYLKYSQVSFIKVWGIFYAIIIGVNLIVNLLGLMP
jgi:hypothetical protein